LASYIPVRFPLQLLGVLMLEAIVSWLKTPSNVKPLKVELWVPDGPLLTRLVSTPRALAELE
jgi:hypothetical protein